MVESTTELTLASETMATSHTELLRQAVVQLEIPTFADKVTSLMGKPAEFTIRVLPEKYQRKLSDAVNRTIEYCFTWVLQTVEPNYRQKPSSDVLHKFASGGAGAVTGFFGGGAFLLELPLTTGLLLRTIADIARSEGENLSELEVRQACLAVLALDPATVRGDHLGIGSYYMLRKSLNKLVTEASTYLAQAATVASAKNWSIPASSEVAATVARHVPTGKTASPAMVRLMNEIAARFGVTVSERAAAGMIPVIGAACGATVNVAFMNHFQRIAHGHFTVRKLERIYGENIVAAKYQSLRQSLGLNGS